MTHSVISAYLGVDLASKLSRLSIDASGGPLLINRSVPTGVVMMIAHGGNQVRQVAGGKRGLLAACHNRSAGWIALGSISSIS